MPQNNTIKYQSEFLRVIPVLWVSCIRVPHPCAGRHQTKQALFMLPLDLHVLSLSLAFILSQDQTLHCTFYFFVCSLNSSVFIVVNFLTVVFLFTLYLYYIFVVSDIQRNTVFSFSGNLSRLRMQSYNIFLNHQNIYNKKFQYFYFLLIISKINF